MAEVAPYLARIGYTGDARPTVETLNALQKAHLLHIPYENLDLMWHCTGSLEPEVVYEKVVKQMRGGYCFELNGLFAWLLRQLGYEVTEYFARWLLGEGPFPARRHRILKVKAEGEYFIVDAGVGCVCPLTPLKFELDTVQQRDGRAYRIVKQDKLGYVIQTDAGKGFVNFYSFTEDPHWTVDFLYVHYYLAHSPDSIFNYMAKIHIYTPEGRNFLSDDPDPATGKIVRTVRLGKANGLEKFTIETPEEFYQVLKDHFMIDAPFVLKRP